jgi:tRNA(Arg) A34 adenosine deaminase TadA
MSDAHPFVTRVTAQLPDWLLTELHTYNTLLPTAEDRVRLTNKLATRNYKEGNGGPFAALVVDPSTGELISLGVNVVLSSGLSSVHAEVMALSLAQSRLGTWDLGSAGGRQLELVVNWRPCTMCYGALIWSGVKHLLIAGHGPECEELTGFDEGPMPANWREELEGRGISVNSGVLRDDAIAVFAEYGRSGSIVYNARGTGSRRRD